MKFAVILLTALPLLYSGQERVRTEQPTVMTVYGKQDRVKPKKARKRLLGRLGGAPGWLLNMDDVIPAARERRQSYR